jgi:2-alkyl-3-oxoalkanoate reductase
MELVNALVTGGGGFLGLHIVEKLVARGDRVSVLARRPLPAFESLGIETVLADIRDREAVERACKGMDAVFHVAAKTGVWGRAGDFFSINADGTINVIDGCLVHGVRRLVFTSSPSVVWNPKGQLNADESAPYPARFNCRYPESKAAAERLVLAANGVQGLMTVSLRPHLIWGPRDSHLIPRIVERARAGRLRRVGDGTNLVDIVHVENAADAHLLAADRLKEGSKIGGQAYFITQGEPVNLWDWINQILERIGVPKVDRSISYGAAWAAGAILEGLYTTFGLRGEPPMTRFVANQLATSHTFDISKARRDLGYSPRISTEEGLQRLIESLKKQ